MESNDFSSPRLKLMLIKNVNFSYVKKLLVSRIDLPKYNFIALNIPYFECAVLGMTSATNFILCNMFKL